MSWTEIALRLGAATLIGLLIGLDRELRHKSAGVRTIGLVALGTAVATLTVTLTSSDSAVASRVIQGALAGIGFLGAGVIVRHRDRVDGLTTAASIWAASVLGAGCGLGAWKPIAVGAGLVLLLLGLAGWIEYSLTHRNRHLKGRTSSGGA